MPKPNVAARAVTWINYDLTKQDKAKLAEYFADGEVLERGLSTLAGGGYKLQITFDTWAEAYAVYVFPGTQSPVNKGMALASRARTVHGALCGVVFRHFCVFDGNWRAPEAKVSLDD